MSESAEDFIDSLEGSAPDPKPAKAEKKGSRRVRIHSPEPELDKVSRSGRCSAYAPRGTRCKLCGKVHP